MPRMSHEEADPAQRRWGITRAGLFGLIAIWPVFWGWSLVHSIGAAAFMLLFVWLPGRALVAWTIRPASVLERVLLSWTAGFALLGIAFFATAQFDVRPALWGLPVAGVLALLLGRGREADAEALPVPARGELLVLALVLFLTLLRVRPDMPGEWYLGFGSDDEFHASNAADIRWRWPIGDPRVAGEPLRYHFLSYSCSALMARVLGLPVRECIQGLSQHHMPILIAYGMFVLARAFRANAWISAAAALALVLHADFGELAQPLTGENWWAATPFYVGVYRSITNAAGLTLLIGLLLVLQHVLSRRESWRGPLLLAFVIAATTSLTKSSVLPPLIGGLGLALAWKFVRRQGLDWSLARCLLAVGLGAAPVTIWFLSDTGGYAYSMFRFLPVNGVRMAPMTARIGELLGLAEPTNSMPFLAALFPLWLALFFGLTALGLVYWFLARSSARERDPLELPLFCTVLAGLVPGLVLASPGLSELFFADISVVASAPLGALAAQWLFKQPGRRARALAIAGTAVLCLYAAASYTWVFIRPTFPVEETGDPQRFRDALDWMRANLPPEAVVIADDVRLSVGVWSERRMFYTTPRYSRKQRATWDAVPRPPGSPPPPQPYAPRENAQRNFLAHPTPEGLAQLHELLGTGAPIYALRSPASMTVHHKAYHADVPPRDGVDPLENFPGAKRVYANEVAAVYRLP